jgi:hypothetical protein
MSSEHATAFLLQEIWQHTVAVSPVTNTLARPVYTDIALGRLFRAAHSE